MNWLKTYFHPVSYVQTYFHPPFTYAYLFPPPFTYANLFPPSFTFINKQTNFHHLHVFRPIPITLTQADLFQSPLHMQKKLFTDYIVKKAKFSVDSIFQSCKLQAEDSHLPRKLYLNSIFTVSYLSQN